MQNSILKTILKEEQEKGEQIAMLDKKLIDLKENIQKIDCKIIDIMNEYNDQFESFDTKREIGDNTLQIELDEKEKLYDNMCCYFNYCSIINDLHEHHSDEDKKYPRKKLNNVLNNILRYKCDSFKDTVLKFIKDKNYVNKAFDEKRRIYQEIELVNKQRSKLVKERNKLSKQIQNRKNDMRTDKSRYENREKKYKINVKNDGYSITSISNSKNNKGNITKYKIHKKIKPIDIGNNFNYNDKLKNKSNRTQMLITNKKCKKL